jgi:hypothetical protein
MSIMGQRALPRGTDNSWEEAGSQPGPEGSNLFASFYGRGGKSQCADVEEAIGKTKRRLCRIEGENAHARAVAWMDGFMAGREHSKRAPITETTRRKRSK